ncbi:MAG: hypothetical protein Athens101410_351 [Parcubacteria group bacterium Athens1014_10]|nr:MAG: hypothetical protein Athens101410_351 [Parcubacteria group bacterium Athens1014_10]TSD05167.1 MAG: hypothetical protein Athens071412_469 [Parcubacteria group bacterium Athens0714_12]
MNLKSFVFFLIFGLALIIIFSASGILKLLTDWYWFQEIGFSGIFTTILRAKILLGLAIGIISFFIIYFNFWLIKKITASNSDVIDMSQDGKNIISLGGLADKFILLISLFLGFITGLFGASNWETVLKYFNSVPFNAVDPIFNRDLSFYFFDLPFIQFAVGLGFWMIIVCLISAALSYSARGAANLGRSAFNMAGISKFLFITKQAKIHISILIALLFVLLSFNTFAVKIPSLLYSSMGSFTGAGYTEINAILPFLKILGIIAFAAAILTIVNIFKSSNRFIFIAVGAYILISILGGAVYPALIQKFVVLPNELAKETTYIEYNIKATREAFGLDKVVERDLAGETTLTMEDINNNQSTIKNVRLWDREPLLDTFGQLQEIRTYYDFVSIDNDRYNLDGDYRQVLLSPRELNSTSLPQRSFINERLTFTHGFGLTLSPVNEVTPEGLPVLFLKDLPPSSSIKSLSVSRPEIYYGELASEWAVANTKTKEFDYPSGDENVFTNYQGSGGVKIGSIFRKALFALKFSSFKIFLSDDITSDSRIMYYRNIEERVKKALPFLHFDSDPYMVLTKDGDLKWIYDAYIISDRYPYAEPMPNAFSVFPGSKLNYIRNSVKIVISAYDGKMKFYISDQDDPIIQSYAKIFKNVFLPLSEMDDDLIAHIRYPEDLFSYQTELYATYHMGEAQIFYNKEDQWQIPYITGKGRTDPIMRHMIMKLPEEEKEEFILMIPFTPRGKDNLSAWMVARNDGEAYGQLMVYRFPKQKLVFGPKQITNRISQDAEISQEISLWDQRGSEVIMGNLLVIPIEGALIYIQPIYLRAEGGRIPELKRVIVAYENRIAMEENLNAALARVFGGKVVADGKVDKTTPASATDTDLIKQINNHYNRAMNAQRQGDWSLYGEEIKKLGELLKKAK